jgi:2-pyrone-4,6-dicarboxylate lactonase
MAEQSLEKIPPLPPLPGRPSVPLPPGACDSHGHIFGPFDRFPLAASRSYTPPEATFEAHRAMMEAVGFSRAVVVQGSAHGTDNRAILDGVARSDGRLRGIVVIDNSVTDEELANMAASGIVGARFTELVSTRYAGGMKGVSRFSELEKLGPRLREHGLHAQLFSNCPTIVANLDMLLGLDLPLVIDHMGRIGPGDWGPTDADFQRLLACVREGRMWVKLTALRSSRDFPDYADARPFHEAFVAANPDRLLFGSDWPLLNLGERTPDVGKLVDIFRDWTGPELSERILVDNPARLYGFGPI